MAKTTEAFSTAAAAEAASDNTSTTDTSEKANASPSKERSFFSWFDKNDGPVERRLILKLDILTLSFACMGFWVTLLNPNFV
jgi:hypothetical protein